MREKYMEEIKNIKQLTDTFLNESDKFIENEKDKLSTEYALLKGLKNKNFEHLKRLEQLEQLIIN